ncbi:Cupredoxin [Collybia nuda]|uniref:Cupredoxin n=1 Tax=Collybia nuda TaxID=64659 RepID=A0A9P5YGQ5_9AGAR|nr:Cupredoxin [Collybia nuda]
MRFFAVAAATLVSVAYAERITVTVGENNGLTYSPESVTAKVGDTIAFRFMSKNHTVTQSTFVKPCEAMTAPTAGIDSGFQPVPAGATEFPEWSFTVDDESTPFWFFCNQAPHCSRGMVFAVNPTAEKTFTAFKATAVGAPADGSPTGTTPGNGTNGPSGSDSGTPGSSETDAPNNGAGMLSGSKTVMLSVIGLVAGLVL